MILGHLNQYGMSRFLCVVFFMFRTVFLAAQDQTLETSSLIEKMAEQLVVYPQEKVHVHIDRSTYTPGDTIWFRAYPVHATFHTPRYQSRYIYAELWTPQDSLVERVRIRVDSLGIYSGYLAIPDDAAEGRYALRAYTRYMLSQGTASLYSRAIDIRSVAWNGMEVAGSARIERNGQTTFDLRMIGSGTQLPVPAEADLRLNGGVKSATLLDGRISVAFPPGEVANNRSVLLEMTDREGYAYRRYYALTSGKEDFRIGFYPEGGHLLSGVPNRLAFKAEDISGGEARICVELLDGAGEVLLVDSAVYAGMGSFEFTPQAGERYRARCTNPEGLEKAVELPEVQPAGYGLRVESEPDSIAVWVNRATGTPPSPLYLIAHVRGAPVYAGRMNGTEVPVVFDRKAFPPGVIQFLLLDENFQVMSERLSFSSKEPALDFVLVTDREVYGSHEKVTVNLGVSDSLGNPVKADLSVAVTDSAMQIADTAYHINAALLLSSELKGHIETPSFYLRADDPLAVRALDLLLLTQGWRRYDLPEVWAGNLKHPADTPERGIRISGQVKSGGVFNRGKPGRVIVFDKRMEYSKEIMTDKEGYFSFDEVEFPDGIGFEIVGMENDKKENNRLPVVIEEVDYPAAGPSFPQPRFTDLVQQESDGLKHFWIGYTGGEKHFFIPAVEVKASYLGSTDYVQLDERELAKRRYRDMYDLLTSLGLDIVTNDRGYVRRLNYEKEHVHVYIDYRPYVDPGLLLNNIRVESIQQLAFVPDAEFMYINDMFDINIMNRDTTFGHKTPFLDIITKDSYDLRQLRWANPITLIAGGKKIQDEKSGVVSLFPLGYQQPVEFYAPLYDREQQDKERRSPEFRPTIHWKPDIQTDSTGKASFSFYTSDKPATYTAVIEGITEKGDIIYEIREIKVGLENKDTAHNGAEGK